MSATAPAPTPGCYGCYMMRRYCGTCRTCPKCNEVQNEPLDGDDMGLFPCKACEKEVDE